MIFIAAVLLLSSLLLLFSDLKKEPPVRIITEKEAENLDVYIFLSRLSGFGSLYVADKNGRLFDWSRFL